MEDSKRCDCNACKQRRAGQISSRTSRVPGTHEVHEIDERDPAVVAASRRMLDGTEHA